MFINEKCHGLTCCGEQMQELVAGSTDAATEKHVPVVELDGKKVVVTVGSTIHPMQDNHFIEWIILETTKGVYKKNLKPLDEPVATFVLEDGEEILHAYEYCNLHGLWEK